MNRYILVAAASLSLLAGAILLFLPPKERLPTSKMGTELVSLAEQVGVEEISIQESGKAALVLKKGDSGVWYLEQDRYPVNPGRLQTFFKELSDAKIRSAMPRTADDDREYGLNDGTVIVLRSEGQLAQKKVTFGGSRAGGGVFVRLEDEEQVFLVGRSVNLHSDPTYWENKALLHLPREKVKSVTVKNNEGKEVISYSRNDGNSDFTVPGSKPENLNQYELKNLAGFVENFVITARHDKNDEAVVKALAKPYQIELSTFTNSRLVLLIGTRGIGDKMQAFVSFNLAGEIEGMNAALLNDIKNKWVFEVPTYLIDRIKKSKQEFFSGKS